MRVADIKAGMRVLYRPDGSTEMRGRVISKTRGPDHAVIFVRFDTGLFFAVPAKHLRKERRRRGRRR